MKATITVRELLKQISNGNVDLDSGIYVSCGEEGSQEVYPILNIGFDEDGETYVVFDKEATK